MTSRPFPAITGGCYCTAVRYRLMTSPLFCYACHCTDCQKNTGSAFALHVSIETYNISVISKTKPSLVTITPDPAKPDKASKRAHCPKCGVTLWGHDNSWGYAVCDVRIGTLDFPGIMEPDAHSFVGTKVGWLDLPQNARTFRGQYDYKTTWPKSSLKRLDACLEKYEAAKKSIEQREATADTLPKEKSESAVDGDGEKTPTATGDVDDAEDEEAFEKRFKETELALQERLAKLSLKLEEDEEEHVSSATAS